MKMIERRIKNKSSNENVFTSHEYHYEGPDLNEINFDRIFDIFNEKDSKLLITF